MPKRIHWKHELQDIFNQHNDRAAKKDKTVSYRTRQARAELLFNCIREVYELGYKLQSVRSLGGRHVQALVDHWVAQKLGPGTIQQKLSVLRTFCSWIGKDGMVLEPRHYVPDAALVTRRYIPIKDKSWTSNQVDPQTVLSRVNKISPVIALALEAEWLFGLRRRESLMLKPNRADQGPYLIIDSSDGPKNGRSRVVPVDTPVKRDYLDRVSAYVKFKETRLGELLTDRNGKQLTLEQAVKRFQNVMTKTGITQSGLGVTPHGLRHQYANDKYRQLTGQDSPVRGGQIELPLDGHDARQQVSRELGHERVGITSAYLGGLRGYLQRRRLGEEKKVAGVAASGGETHSGTGHNVPTD